MAPAGRADSAAMEADWNNALTRARAHAPFLARGLERMPELAAMLAAGRGEDALAHAREAGADIADVRTALRRERLAYAVALAVGDLAGAFPVGRVMQELSDLADRALDAAIRAAILRRVPDADLQEKPTRMPTGMIALALGKHGAQELNYSSDIDPILLFDPETLPRRDRDEPGEAAQRYARDIVQILSENTAEGYVFRVDLRLRPASEVSPLAISLDAALTHYESSALTWERAAYIRARPCSGDIDAGRAFLAAIRPFVWRRSLDFGAIEEIGRLTARIRDNYRGPKVPGPGFNLKHGRGGIREVEFFAQTHQLIHGGRDPSLRQRSTRPALDSLAAAGHISAEDAAVLGAAYDRLRTLEHRLQMVDDQQTHALPSGTALDNVARLEGFADGAAMVAEVRELTEEVGARFDRLIDAENRSVPGSQKSSGGLADLVARLDFADPEALLERIRGWTDGRFRTLRSPAACAAFEAILPDLIEALGQASDPDGAILRWEALLAGASSAINLFRLLEARPALLDQLVKILTLAPPLAGELGRRPELLDTLIDRSALDLPGNVLELAQAMRSADGHAADYEQRLDRIRIVTGEKRFALGVQLVGAAHDPLAIGAALSRVAEAAIEVAGEAANASFVQAHGFVADSELVVLGLGRLGGGIMTHASDLDIIYLFSGTHEGESDCGGRANCRPLGTTLYFNRLATRVSAALSVPTAEGALYEVDTRLRPQGAQGPLAVSFDSFARYQRESAWTWEHMALTRARVLCGSPSAREELEALVADVLGTPRDPAQLRTSLLDMRSEMAAHKSPKGPLDAKLLRGALVDLEFIVHYLQLRERTAFHPDLGTAISALVAEGYLPEELGPAHDLMIRMLVAARLLAPDLQQPPPAAFAVLAQACGCVSGTSLLHDFTAARQSVARSWKAILETDLETE
ncbi:bifunctional [glutamine synthetase] adenylyltransferase/[glutamine synthetase]-adenylyl-L-tyrosine phosphorylase [Allopontixanthobacter sediminis]|nr:bifunctional [glutamine synthetase] adenylyltransferase/[glutamine synthetase]-adenylyl-L-tyrosine phosphorylase [Allopontixanthobacter sediminis]